MWHSDKNVLCGSGSLPGGTRVFIFISVEIISNSPQSCKQASPYALLFCPNPGYKHPNGVMRHSVPGSLVRNPAIIKTFYYVIHYIYMYYVYIYIYIYVCVCVCVCIHTQYILKYLIPSCFISSIYMLSSVFG